MLPLAADEDLHGAVIRGLRRREPGLDLVTVHEAGLRRSPDPVILDWAARAGRILITQDANAMTGHAWDRVRSGLPMPGVLVRDKDLPIGRSIDEILLAPQCGSAEDFKDQVRFLPL
jgi:hypothetical protein